ncbi:MAG: M1 family metallopeptidase [Bacteroidetes bacterium]|nr:M1 family metallopeptidase [Bacteroidota bacterium]
MKKLLFILSLLITIAGFAQENNHPADTSWKHLYRAEATKINDLTDTKLDVRFDYDKSYLYGKAWLTLHPHFYPTDSLNLDAKGMDIKEVALYTNGKKTPLQYIYDNKNLRITLNKTYKKDENYTVFIDYVAKPDEWKEEGSAAITGAKGLYFINPRGEEKNKPTQIWTQGETEHNSVWMPTIDKPNQKTTEQITMTVPAKYVTLSNGLLISQKKNADGTRTDVWKMDLPHSPYLFFMGVGDYSIIKDSYKEKEVSYYVEKQYAPVARAIFGHTPEMIKFYSTILGIDYPWQKYSQIVGRDYVSGAMENTTATLHGEGAYQDARELKDENKWEDVIAHELFHQWFGDYVTTESWSNITVNESFADFSETLWNEYKYGQDKGDEKFYNDLQQYLNSGEDTVDLVRFYYRDKEDVFDGVSYPKGGCILNMLRHYVGKDAFFASLHKYLTDNKFGNGEAQQLRLAFEAVTGQDLNWFWNEWYYGAGHPILDISYLYDDVAHTAKVIVQQQQTGQIFKMPVNIDIYNGANKTRHQVWIQNPVDTFTFTYTTRPDLINFDGDKILLCEKADHKTADNFKAQWKYAPLYLDRREAIEYFAANNMIDDLKLGMNDKYFGIRNITLDFIKQNTAAIGKPDVIQTVEAIAMKDDNNTTKARAMSILAVKKDAQYKSIFEKSINDSSYSVAGAALKGISGIDSAEAYSLAKKLSTGSKGELDAAITGIIIKAGKPEDYNMIAQKYDDMPLSQQKIRLTPVFCSFLSKIDDVQKIKDGIDKVMAFRNSIPQQYQGYIDPTVKAGLDEIIATKGDVIKEYVASVFK